MLHQCAVVVVNRRWRIVEGGQQVLLDVPYLTRNVFRSCLNEIPFARKSSAVCAATPCGSRKPKTQSTIAVCSTTGCRMTAPRHRPNAGRDAAHPAGHGGPGGKLFRFKKCPLELSKTHGKRAVPRLFRSLWLQIRKWRFHDPTRRSCCCSAHF